MDLRSVALFGVVWVMLVAPAATGLHTEDDGQQLLDTGPRSFTVQLATPIWWDHTQVRGVSTGLTEQTHLFEISNPNGAVTVTAETFPRNTPDTPKVCSPAGPTPPVFVSPLPGTAIVHPIQCVKENGYSVQVHYFPWTIDEEDPDHVLSPTLFRPTATTVWRVDAVPTSYKTATIPSSGSENHWQVWIDPAISPGEYTVVWRAFSDKPFYFDYLGTRGCAFYASIAPDVGDQALLGCPDNYI